MEQRTIKNVADPDIRDLKHFGNIAAIPVSESLAPK
jgi:hypothetical protein